MTATTPDSSTIHVKGGAPAWILRVAVGMPAVLVAGGLTAWFGMWFAGRDADWLAWAVEAPSLMAPGPPDVEVGWQAGPVAAAVWWGAFRVFGWRYGWYQFSHTLLWLGVLVVYASMLRQMWGRRRRPGAVATVLVAVALVGYSEQILHVMHLAFTLELLLGFASAALAAAGWHHRRWWLVVGGWVLLVGACAGSLPAPVYLLGLHAAPALMSWGRRSLRPWIVAAVLVTAAVAGGCAWWTGPPGPAWSFADGLARLDVFRRAVTTGPTALMFALLAAGAGLVQAMKRNLQAWPLVAAIGAVMALTCLGLHPLIVVVALAVMTPVTWPFALWAVVQQVVVASAAAPWPEMRMAALFAYVPVFVLSILRSPLAVWADRFGRRLDPTGRRLIYSVAALIALLLAAHSGEWLQQHSRALRTLGRRRQLHCELLHEVVATVPRGATVSIVTPPAAATDRPAADRLTPLSRARVTPSFTPQQYERLLAARSRDDLHVAGPSELRRTGGWLLITSHRDLQFAEEVLGPLGNPEMMLSTNEIIGGLWRIRGAEPAAEITEPPGS